MHGRLLTAWSTAGVLGPVLINYIREYRIAQGVPKAEAYSVTMYVMAVLLVIGFIANVNKEDLVALRELIEAGKVTPVIDRTYPLADTAEGLRYVEQGHARGKAVVTVA